jgi:hypothetical protein
VNIDVLLLKCSQAMQRTSRDGPPLAIRDDLAIVGRPTSLKRQGSPIHSNPNSRRNDLCLSTALSA